MTHPATHRPSPPASSPTPLQVVRGYVLLPHAVPIIVVLAATAGFALVAAGGWPGLIPMATLLGAMLGGQLAVGAINELVDADLDAIAQPHKPIPAGLVSRRGAWVMTIAGLLLMTVLSLRFGPASFLICGLGNGAGIAYSLWFKRTIWSWVPYLVALPLLPIWVWTSLSEVHPGLLAIYPIGAPAVIAVQIAQSLPDIAADQQASVRTLAVALGPARARRACWTALLLAALVAVALAPRLTGHPAPVMITALIAAALIVLNALIWRQDARRGAVAAFPCVATGAVALGLGWTIALLTP
jgi:4-hydroxybenzoate polyprenyltransferase